MAADKEAFGLSRVHMYYATGRSPKGNNYDKQPDKYRNMSKCGNVMRNTSGHYDTLLITKEEDWMANE